MMVLYRDYLVEIMIKMCSKSRYAINNVKIMRRSSQRMSPTVTGMRLKSRA